MRCRVLPGLALVLLTGSLLRADEGISARRLAELRSATVYVKFETGRRTTGTLFRMDENTYVATAYPEQSGKVSVILRPGTKSESELPAEIVGFDEKTHLAVLKVSAKSLPRALELSQRVDPHESMTI